MKNAKAFLCILLVLVMLCLCGCSGGAASHKLKTLDFEGSISEKAKSKDIFVQKNKKEALQKIATTDMATLYFDKQNYGVSVYDMNAKKLWNSLPQKYSDGSPCVLSVDVYLGSKKFTLNSQTDSVQKGLAKFEKGKNEITVTYNFESEIEGTAKVSLSVPVKYKISDSTLTVNIDCAQIKNESSKNVTIAGIGLLEYFGSSTSGSKGDFIFIPEGCGVVIDTEKKAKKFKKISVPVYGADFASGEKSDLSAKIAAFGMKSGEGAFVALALKGEANAQINAAKALEKKSYNRVGAHFDITKVCKNDKAVYASNKPYDGEIEISYRFLSGENATYAAMASACRESLIRNGTLGFAVSERADEYPFILSLIGAATVTKEKTKTQTLTDFDEAQEIISFLRSKGISNILLRYKGMFGGQLLQNDINKLKISSKLGSGETLEAFLQYTDLQNIAVYPEINLLSAKRGKLKSPAVAIDGKKIAKETVKIKTDTLQSVGTSNFTKLSAMDERTNSLLAKLSNYSFAGVCLADVGNFLYTDYSTKTGRKTASDIVAKQTASISPQKSVMIDGGNIYSVKYADFIANLPNTSSLSKRDYCTAVPFLQILLHGVIPYSGKAVNLCGDADNAVLRAAEYGELLSYEFYYANDGNEEANASDSRSFMNYSSHAQSAYERLGELYADLSSKRITDHYKVKKGVYCTQFGGDVSVYVNYNSKDISVNGVTVEAKSFLKVE